MDEESVNASEVCVEDGLYHITETGGNQYRCTVCDKTFTMGSSLNNHTSTRTLNIEGSNCGKTFTKNSELTKYLRIHTGENCSNVATAEKRLLTGGI